MTSLHIRRGRALAFVFAGGCVGTLLRALASIAFPSSVGSWPWATFAVNLAGAYVLGRVLRLVRRGELDAVRQLFLATGLSGSLTTFSALAIEVVQLAQHSDLATAFLYAGSSVVLGLVVAAAGLGVEP